MSTVVFPDPPNGANEPNDCAERDAARGEEEPQTSGAKVAGSMTPKTRCLRVAEQSEIARTGAESRSADDEKKVLKGSHGDSSLHRQIHHGASTRHITDSHIVIGGEEPTSGELTGTSFAPGVDADVETVSSHARRFFLADASAHRHASVKGDKAKPDITRRRSAFRAITAPASQAP
jgi:hypothetical protein